MVLDALDAGKDVYVEKPMTYTVDEGREIMAAVARTQRVVQVGSQGPSSMRERHAREIVRSGRLGQITLVRAAFNRNSAGGAWLYPIPPDATPQTVDWQRFLGSAPARRSTSSASSAGRVHGQPQLHPEQQQRVG